MITPEARVDTFGVPTEPGSGHVLNLPERPLPPIFSDPGIQMINTTGTDFPYPPLNPSPQGGCTDGKVPVDQKVLHTWYAEGSNRGINPWTLASANGIKDLNGNVPDCITIPGQKPPEQPAPPPPPQEAPKQPERAITPVQQMFPVQPESRPQAPAEQPKPQQDYTPVNPDPLPESTGLLLLGAGVSYFLYGFFQKHKTLGGCLFAPITIPVGIVRWVFKPRKK